MVQALVRWSLQQPLIVMLLSVALLAAGGWRLCEASWDVFPEFAPPQVVVQAEAPGFSTEEVEQLVTIPVETALAGVARLEVLRSSSVPGLCVATAVFEEGTNVLAARQLVAERLAEVRANLPDAAETPRLMPMTSSTSRLLMAGLTSDGRTDPQQLRKAADWTFRRRLQAVPGVAHVEVFGGEVREYQVLVDPLRLQTYGATLDEVLAAARSATAFGGAGFVETANQRLPIRQRTRLEGPADLAAAPVAMRGGATLALGQVADVQLGAADRWGSAVIDGVDGVLLVVHKQPDADTLETTAAVEAALAELRSALPPGAELHPRLFRQAAFIERAIGNLRSSLLVGCILVAVVLVLFLRNPRVLFISLTAIPLSLLGAAAVLLGGGATLNAMTLGGLAIALGEVVDDAVVDVENVLRRLRENHSLPCPRAAFDVILDASLEVRSAVVYASFIVLTAFLPVFFLDGLAGRIFGPLGAAYAVAILVSLGVALTVTPALCLLLLSGPNAVGGADTETLLVRVANALYRRLLPYTLRRPLATTAAAALIAAGSLAAIPFLGGEFLPDFRESNFVIFMAGKADGSLLESERAGKRLARRLKEIPGVRSIAQQIGRADLSEDTWGPNVSEVWVSLDDGADYDRVLRDVRAVLDDSPGWLFQVKQFLRERIDEVLTGSTADLVVRIVGDDPTALRKGAAAAAEAMGKAAGVADLRIEQLVDAPQIEILLKPAKLTRYGLSAGAANGALQTLLKGSRTGQVYEGDAVFDVVVRGAAAIRSDPQALGELLLEAPGGERIPLRSLAEVGIGDAPNMSNREQGRKRLLVTCNAVGRDVAGVVADVRRRLAEEVRLPEGCRFEFAGEFEAKAEAQNRMLGLGAAALVGVFALLLHDFRSVRLSLIVMLSVPLACVGGIVSVAAAGGEASLGTLVGFVTVFGIAVRNGILLVGACEREQAEGGGFDADSVAKACVGRLAPILMTAGTTALAIAPLAVAGNLPGHEVEHPMAVVVVGGWRLRRC